jgi:hypothetical protein
MSNIENSWDIPMQQTDEVAQGRMINTGGDENCVFFARKSSGKKVYRKVMLILSICIISALCALSYLQMANRSGELNPPEDQNSATDYVDAPKQIPGEVSDILTAAKYLLENEKNLLPLQERLKLNSLINILEQNPNDNDSLSALSALIRSIHENENKSNTPAPTPTNTAQNTPDNATGAVQAPNTTVPTPMPRNEPKTQMATAHEIIECSADEKLTLTISAGGTIELYINGTIVQKGTQTLTWQGAGTGTNDIKALGENNVRIDYTCG